PVPARTTSQQPAQPSSQLPIRPRPAEAADAVGELDDGSIVTEYGLVAVVGATIAAVAINWASSGGIYDLFAAVLEKVKVIIGA
ncbi:MAG: hypothetical protein R3249_11245, partial [Nitriliruptorales bacterium]|nr:hypothetical protein [Nitriliruptorales bacterium]